MPPLPLSAFVQLVETIDPIKADAGPVDGVSGEVKYAAFTVDEAVNRVGYDQVYELVSYAVALATAAGHKWVRWICRGTGDLPTWKAACELAALLSVTPSMQDRT